MKLLSTTICISLVGYFSWSWQRDDRTAFLPGASTHGHYQIELTCQACHTPFDGATQDACVTCHADALERADDSHPKSKFSDPRNADRLEHLDARLCVTCHVEHRPQSAQAMGVTQPTDHCRHCHGDIAEERPTHVGLAFDGCQSTGCHNFHDNRALHEDFLEQNMHAPDLVPNPRLRLRVGSRASPVNQALTASDQDAPKTRQAQASVVQAWSHSSHARNGVNCSDCHQAGAGAPAQWVDRPGFKTCQKCHQGPVEGFLSGHHGMRLAQGLTPMRPAEARLPMKPESYQRALGCSSCHGAHSDDRTTAAADACIACHDDEHSRAYEQSAHGHLWRAEIAGDAAAGTGVSCATCHLPRKMTRTGNTEDFSVEHNQNDNLRPNEKFIRGVCMQCHGVPFVLDALADRELIRRNFAGRPGVHVESIDMIARKQQRAELSHSR